MDTARPALEGLNTLKTALRGEVLRPADPGYGAARQLWNGMIDRRPAAILRCKDTQDVVLALAFARSIGVELTVRGGGHSIAGKSSCDGGLVIDLTLMRAVEVDPAARTVRCGAGVLLSEMDTATQAHGLAVPSGLVGHTGIAGLTLGGGQGRMSRKFGLTCDNLLEAEVVLADGRVVRASASNNADLFWGLCGGGGNLGIVTQFTFRAHRLGPEIHGGLVLHPGAHGLAVLRHYRDFCLAAADEVSADAVMMATPEGPFVGISACHVGVLDEGERALQSLCTFGTPAQVMMGPTPYLALQTSLDDLFAYGRRFYWKSFYLNALPDSAVDVLLDQFARVPAPPSVITLQLEGGAITRRPESDAAFANRDAQWNCVPIAIWDDPAEDARNIAWIRGLFDAMRPFASGGVYVNDLGDEGEERIRAAYGANFTRLAAVKAKYDPDNIFRANQNIRPNGVTTG
jgi:FAD/FMN-containing dehydrogenase